MINRTTLEQGEDVAARIARALEQHRIPICSPVITTGVDLHIPQAPSIGVYNQTQNILQGEAIR